MSTEAGQAGGQQAACNLPPMCAPLPPHLPTHHPPSVLHLAGRYGVGGLLGVHPCLEQYFIRHIVAHACTEALW